MRSGRHFLVHPASTEDNTERSFAGGQPLCNFQQRQSLLSFVRIDNDRVGGALGQAAQSVCDFWEVFDLHSQVSQDARQELDSVAVVADYNGPETHNTEIVPVSYWNASY
jgi:hypothetical protein